MGAKPENLLPQFRAQGVEREHISIVRQKLSRFFRHAERSDAPHFRRKTGRRFCSSSGGASSRSSIVQTSRSHVPHHSAHTEQLFERCLCRTGQHNMACPDRAFFSLVKRSRDSGDRRFADYQPGNEKHLLGDNLGYTSKEVEQARDVIGHPSSLNTGSQLNADLAAASFPTQRRAYG